MEPTNRTPLRWIVIENTPDFLGRWLLPLGGDVGYLHLIEQPDGWAVEQIGRVVGSDLIGRTTLAGGCSYERARRFAEAYALACRPSRERDELVQPGAEWRRRPMTDLQRARLTLLLGEEPSATLTSGEASDLFHEITAQRMRERAVQL